jgi:hypothetical protein|eukprot:Stramenopile-MAST_4_protein_2931
MKVSSTQIMLLRAALVLFELLAFALIAFVKLKPAFMEPYLTKEYELGYDKTLTWHPVMMTLAFSVFMNEGLIAFYMGDLVLTPRDRSRKTHGMLQLLALVTIVAAYFCMFSHNTVEGNDHFAMHTPKVGYKVHVYLGYTVIFLCLVQVSVGIRKYLVKTKTGVSVQKWHGYLGLLVYLLGQTNVVIGGFNCSHIEAYCLRIMMLIFVFMSVVTLLVTRHIAIKIKENEGSLGVPLMYHLPDEPGSDQYKKLPDEPDSDRV